MAIRLGEVAHRLRLADHDCSIGGALAILDLLHLGVLAIDVMNCLLFLLEVITDHRLRSL